MASFRQRGPSWRAEIRRRGQVLSRTFDTLPEAEAWAKVEEARVLRGATARQVRQTPSTLTVAALFERYASEVSPEKGGWRWETIRLAKLAKDFPIQATSLDGAAMAEWRDKRLKKVCASTVNRELNLISAVLTRAIKEWRLPLPANPVHQIQRPKMPPSRRRRVSDAERAAILAQLGWDGVSAPAGRKQWVAWTFAVALETMCRQGEVLGLTREHVHLDRRFVHLPKTKNGHSRDVPLSRAAMALFQLVPDGDPTRRIAQVDGGTLGKYFRDAVKAAGIEGLHFHDSRREALTRIAPKFGNPMDLGAASGHRDYRSLRIYYEPNASELAKKLD
jgi:integrase